MPRTLVVLKIMGISVHKNEMSGNDKDLTERAKMHEKSLALRGGVMDMNADVCL